MPWPDLFRFPFGEPGIGWVWAAHIGYEFFLGWIAILLTVWFICWLRRR